MLARGSRGVDVKELQQNLKVLGFDPGGVDGIFGMRTEEAVFKFQQKYGLAVDGVVGPRTQVKIRELLAASKELQGFSVCIDPGHGGKDPGAVDGKNDDPIYTEEEDINLSVGLLLEKKLAAKGARITLTRSRDWYPSLGQRCNIANNFGADVFISLHCNFGPAVAKGSETLYNPASKNGLRLAQLVQQELVKATGAPNRGVKPRTDLAVLNGTDMPAVLSELGFISNPSEEAKLNNPGYQELIADAIVKAVVRYKKGESI